MPSLIVYMAFDRDEEGELRPAVEPREAQSERQAINQARILATQHAGAIAWVREARPDIGEYGDPVILYERSDVPVMD